LGGEIRLYAGNTLLGSTANGDDAGADTQVGGSGDDTLAGGNGNNGNGQGNGNGGVGSEPPAEPPIAAEPPIVFEPPVEPPIIEESSVPGEPPVEPPIAADPPGEYIFEQTHVMTLAQIDPLNVEVFVPTTLFSTIKVGQRASVTPLLPDGREYQASVKIVDRVFDAASGTFGVRLEMPNPGHKLPSGVKCKIQFLKG